MASPAAASGGEMFANAADVVSKFKKEVFSKLAFLGIPHGDASSLKHLWKFVNLTVKLACEPEARQSSQPRKLVRALSRELGVPRAELFVKWLTEKIQTCFSYQIELPSPAEAGQEELAQHSADVRCAPDTAAVVVIDQPEESSKLSCPDGKLDEAWVELKGNDGRIYFWNRRDNSCAWELPAGVKNKWIGQKVPDGRTYYWSRDSSKVCWVLPKLQQAEARSTETKDSGSVPPGQEAEQPPPQSTCESSADAKLSSESLLMPSTPLAGCLVSAPLDVCSSQAFQQDKDRSVPANSVCASTCSKQYDETPVPQGQATAVSGALGTIAGESVMETPVLVAPLPTSAISGARPMLLPEVGLLQPLVLATVPESAMGSSSNGQDLGPFEGALQEAAREAEFAAKSTAASQDDGKEEKIEKLSSKLEEMTADSSNLRAEVALLKRELASLLGMRSAAGQAQQQKEEETAGDENKPKQCEPEPLMSQAEVEKVKDPPRRDSLDEETQPASDVVKRCCAEAAGSSEEEQEAEDDHSKHATDSEQELEDDHARPDSSSEVEAEDDPAEREGDSEDEKDSNCDRPASDSDDEHPKPIPDSEEEDCARSAADSERGTEDNDALTHSESEREEQDNDALTHSDSEREAEDNDALHTDSEAEEMEAFLDGAQSSEKEEEDNNALHTDSEAEASEAGAQSAADTDKEAEDEEPPLKRRRADHPSDADDSLRSTRRKEDKEACDFSAQADSPAPTTKTRRALSPSPSRGSPKKRNAEVSKVACNAFALAGTPERPLASPLRRRPALLEVPGLDNPKGQCVFDFAEPSPAHKRPAASTARSSGWEFWAPSSCAAASGQEDAKSAGSKKARATRKMREAHSERSRSPDGVGSERSTEGDSMLDKFMTPLQGDGMLDKFMTVVKYGKPPGDFNSNESPLSKPPGRWDSPCSDGVRRSDKKHKIGRSRVRLVAAPGKRRRASRGGA